MSKHVGRKREIRVLSNASPRVPGEMTNEFTSPVEVSMEVSQQYQSDILLPIVAPVTQESPMLGTGSVSQNVSIRYASAGQESVLRYQESQSDESFEKVEAPLRPTMRVPISVDTVPEPVIQKRSHDDAPDNSLKAQTT